MNENELRSRYDEGEQAIPEPGRRFFRTISGPDATPYPSDPATVYHVEWLKDVSYTETPGNRTLSSTLTGNVGYVFNLAVNSDGTPTYLPAATDGLAFKQGSQFYTLDPARKATVIVICHWRADIGQGTGSVSRLDEDGNVLWTYDAPIESSTGRRKRPLRCGIDSSGHIYVNYDLEDTSALRSFEYNGDGPAGGCLSLTTAGNLRFDTEFPVKMGALTPGGVQNVRFLPPRVRVSAADEIYCGGATDVNGDQAHRFNANGTLLTSYKFTDEAADQQNGFCHVLGIDGAGKIWGSASHINNSFFPNLFRFEVDGTFLYNIQLNDDLHDIAFDDLDRWVRTLFATPETIFAVGTLSTEPAAPPPARYVQEWSLYDENEMPAGSAAASYDDPFPASPSAIASCVLEADGKFVFGGVARRYLTNVGGTASLWNLWTADASGSPFWIRQMEGTQTSQAPIAAAVGGRVYDLAYDSDSGILLSVGSGSLANAGRLNLATGANVWSKLFGPQDTRIYGCAVRTVNG